MAGEAFDVIHLYFDMNFAFLLESRFSLLVARHPSFNPPTPPKPPFPAILLLFENWLGFSQEGSRRRIYALISPSGGNGSDFSASPVRHRRKPVGKQKWLSVTMESPFFFLTLPVRTSVKIRSQKRKDSDKDKKNNQKEKSLHCFGSWYTAPSSACFMSRWLL